jgi:predicted O-methyltransferase YrrM
VSQITEAIDLGYRVGMFQHRKELETFLDWLTAVIPPMSHVAEIGTLHGGTAALWSRLFDGKIVTMDLPNGQFGGADHRLNEVECKKRALRLAELCPRIKSILGDSKSFETINALREHLNGERLDFLFIDGDHTYSGVAADYLIYRQFVRPGGVIAFHDINNTQFHITAGCLVHEFWRTLTYIYPDFKRFEFTINAEWGGIGAIRV